MNRFLVFLTLVFINSPALFGQTPEIRFQALIDSIYSTSPESIGLLAHVELPKQNISWSGAAGYSDKNKSKKLQPDETAWVASITKMYVSAAILRLIEEDKIDLNQSISGLITKQSQELFKSDGFKLDEIKISHLLSHTSGIINYAEGEYYEMISANPMHRWTRDEQLELAIKMGDPLGKPGEAFIYSDTNFLLLTEIIEAVSGEPFYEAMRDLLRFEELGLNNTWFPTLEEKPEETKKNVNQYFEELNWDTYNIDVSVDLYGGGGIACTTKDLARFNYYLLNGKIIKNPDILNLIYTQVQTKDSVQSNYHLGLHTSQSRGLEGYGHSGFWGTSTFYFPDIDAVVSVFVFRRKDWELVYSTFNQIVKELND